MKKTPKWSSLNLVYFEYNIWYYNIFLHIVHILREKKIIMFRFIKQICVNSKIFVRKFGRGIDDKETIIAFCIFFYKEIKAFHQERWISRGKKIKRSIWQNLFKSCERKIINFPHCGILPNKNGWRISSQQTSFIVHIENYSG